MKLNARFFLSLFLCIIFSACSSVTLIQKKPTTSSMVKAMEWQEAHPIFAKAPNDWTNGAYYAGVVRAHQVTGDKRFLEALQSMAIRNQWKPNNRFYHADDIIITYAYLYLNSLGLQGVNLNPTDTVVYQHLYKTHSWKEEKGLAGQQSILWWWCDALFMAPPTIAYYVAQNNKEDYLKMMDQYYKASYDLLYDKEEYLFARDARYKWTGTVNDLKERNGKKILWSRGNAWVLAGLALTLEHLPKDYKGRSFYENLFKEMAVRIKDLQPEDGLWRTSLLSPESFAHGELSGSAFFTFALAWGINQGVIDKNIYKPVVLKAWKAIKACQQTSGKVGWVQSIGADPKPVAADSWQNYGTGAFLLAGAEIMRLK